MKNENRKEIMLGADPEIFFEKSNGELLRAFDFLPDKYSPLKTPEEGQNYYNDGFQAEFNLRPSSNIGECLDSIRYGLKSLFAEAKKKDSGAKLSTKTVFEVPLEELASLPHNLVEFGCAISYNAHEVSGRGLDGDRVPYRFAGGHIHFGTGRQPEEVFLNQVRTLDAILGVACVSLFENLDNPVRREYYGLAGEFRLPPHGLEYRTLSCAWLFNKKLAEMVLNLARNVVNYANSGKSEWKAETPEVIETILTCNVNMAREILQRNKHCFEQMNFATDIDLMSPAEKSVNMVDVAQNWGI